MRKRKETKLGIGMPATCAATTDVAWPELMCLLNSHSTCSLAAWGPWNCWCPSGKLCRCPGSTLHSAFALADGQWPLASGAAFLKKAWVMQLFLLKILHATDALTRGHNIIKIERIVVNLAIQSGHKPLLFYWNGNRIFIYIYLHIYIEFIYIFTYIFTYTYTHIYILYI